MENKHGNSKQSSEVPTYAVKQQHSSQGDDESNGEAIIAEETIWWTLAGLLIGGASGWFVGIAFGDGKLNIAGLAPLATGGRGVTGFLFSSFFGSLFGLVGALLSTHRNSNKMGTHQSQSNKESKQNEEKTEQPSDKEKKVKQHQTQSGQSHNSKQQHHSQPSFIQRLPIYGSIALALLMVLTLYSIASRALGSGEPSDQSNRVTWNQKNAVRVGGAADAETSQQILQISYPSTRAENRPKAIINATNDWRICLAVTPLMARPFNAALIISGDENGTKEIERLIKTNVANPVPSPTPTSSPTTSVATRPTPNASPQITTQASPQPSPKNTDFAPTLIAVGNVNANGASETIAGNDPVSVAAVIDERLAAARSSSASMNVIIVNADADYRWAVPAGAYAARTGIPILFVTKDGVPNATAIALQKRNGQAHIFVVGPAEAIPSNIFDGLKQFGSVTRIEGDDYFTNAVRFAEFRDDESDFGWGHTGRGSRQYASVNTILVNGDGERWQDAVLSAHLARGGKSGALLFTEKDRLPAVVDNYLWRQRPFFANTPAEGPFNHVWVVGSFDRISYGTQAWADYSQEIEQYMTLGDSAVSGYEALGIGWIILSIACAVWVLFNSIKRLPDVMPMMKAAWAIFALLLGPLAVWLYIASYHKREKIPHEGMTMWQRPLWLQTVSATVMMFAFDMMLMCLAVFFVAYFFGFPIIRFNGSLYWLGSSMFLMMALMYLIALVVMMLVFHTPMTMHEKKINSYVKAFVAGLPMMLATMSVESIGMMPTMWWQQMIFLPAMQMPTEDDITMWTTLLFSVFIGFLIVLPFNYWLVKKGKKIGGM